MDRIHAFAKINLFLNIVGKADGYHQLESLFQTVSLVVGLCRMDDTIRNLLVAGDVEHELGIESLVPPDFAECDNDERW